MGDRSAHLSPPSPDDARSVSVERKRRHTGSDQADRSRYMRPPNTISHRHSEGSSRQTAIDLTSPEQRRPSTTHHNSTNHFRRESSQSRRRGSDMAPARWQPDSEASKCPFCKRDFGLLTRKHHCRKCGRVVCSACSPHRIMIPRQYISRPPNPLEAELGISVAEGEAWGNTSGGESVRVCNPCVPDPWIPGSEAHARAEAGSGQRPEMPRARAASDNNAGARTADDRAARMVRYREIIQGQRPQDAGRPYAHSSSTAQERDQAIGRLHRQHLASNIAPWTEREQRLADSINRGDYGVRDPRMPSTQASAAAAARYRPRLSSIHAPTVPDRISSSRPQAQTTSSTASAPPAQPRPRRVIKEEDECPVCGTELPPGDDLRETHIASCITTHTYGTPSQSSPLPPPPPHLTNPATPSSSTPPSFQVRMRAGSYQPRGMLKYRATEKDCVTEDGEQQECVICMEEFQVGEELGRMECFCKFHRGCIRGWWERKGVGSCPTHQLHE